jgi:hypothetical protein
MVTGVIVGIGGLVKTIVSLSKHPSEEDTDKEYTP